VSLKGADSKLKEPPGRDIETRFSEIMLSDQNMVQNKGVHEKCV
jgi:hypothetical protein